MNAHAGVLDLLGAWALDACDGSEAATVEAHLRDCAGCAAEARRLRSAAGLVGLDRVHRAPPELRQSTLDAARARRAPSLLRTLTEAYAAQVAHLDRLLSALEPADWLRPDPRHTDITTVIAHLARNDAMLAADLELPVITTGRDIHVTWREQADALRQGMREESTLDRPVRLASSGTPPVRPLRDALVQRAFETWTHLEDVGAVVGRRQPVPPAEPVRRIVDLAVRLLPDALRASGMAGDCAVRLDLDGPGGGEWTIPETGKVGVVIAMPAVEFSRLVAGRRSPEALRHTVTGDPAVAHRVLRVAATLGCD